MDTTIKTIKELKAAGYISKSIKEELRFNLIENLKNNKVSFEGIHGTPALWDAQCHGVPPWHQVE